MLLSMFRERELLSSREFDIFKSSFLRIDEYCFVELYNQNRAELDEGVDKINRMLEENWMFVVKVIEMLRVEFF